MTKNTFYVTTPIYYPTGKIHVGHFYSSLAADVLARWNRIIGKEVFFQTGTDEHGQKVKESAKKEGLDTLKYVNNISKQFNNAKEDFNFTYDFFLQTTNEKHKKFVQEMLQKCYDNGDIYKAKYNGLYCIGCERYYAEKELTDKIICPIHKTKCESIEDENYFFKLSKYEKKLLDLYKKNPEFIEPKSKQKEILNRVKEGLQDISISRSKNKLDWGIELPFDNTHVTYVWFDALFNYLSSTRFLKDKKDFWPADIHIIGHDIMWFHTVYWPAFLMSVKEELPKKVFAHGLILDSEGHKMSKSLGNVVDPYEYKEKNILEELKFYLLSTGTFGDDINFSYNNFCEKVNNDLNNDLGNLVSRVHAMTNKYFLEGVPKIQELNDLDYELLKKLNIFEDFNKLIQELKFNQAIDILWTAIRSTNAYINATSPWKETNERRLKTIMNILCSSVYLFAKYIDCVMPSKADRIFKQYNLEKNSIFKLEFIEENHKLGEKDNIFEKIKIEKKEETNELSKFSTLNLKVGKIIEIKEHPEAEKLYIEKIDIGEDKPRQIISGLKDYYTKEEMLNSKVIVVANLKPVKLRGEISQGMVLAADNKENVGLIISDENIGFNLKWKNETANSKNEITIDEFLKIKMKSDGKNVLYQEEKVEGKLKILREVIGKIK